MRDATVGGIGILGFVPLCLCAALPACAAPRCPAQQDWASGAGYGGGYGYGDPYGYGDAGDGAGKAWAREGTYGGFSLQYSIDDFDVPPSLSVDNSPGFGFRIGQRLSDRFAVEGAFDYATGYEVTARSAFFGKETEDLTLWNLAVQGKAYLATDAVQPYLLAGVGFSRVSVDGESDEGVLARVGAGAEVPLSRDAALFGEATWNMLNMSDAVDLDHLAFQVGLLVRF